MSIVIVLSFVKLFDGFTLHDAYEKEETDVWRALNERIQWRSTSPYTGGYC